ncbi:Acetoin utilization deacetylase AcuC [Ferrimonas sediminum]|uniref:Acetoin utilization deacetylase AcuC n=1 Tax=Ferrimonas sediminum TaxID=718193 RepID=A0A1G8RGK5_9GAMM|nr:histone deacetylase [Ferrimonas sediminum]SDJ16051.1 Acetoin utilization deacetylase AcuC [Ferrimonas sediminum]
MIHCVYHPCYSQLVLPQNHGFPITKYQHLYQQLQRHPQQHKLRWHQPDAAPLAQIERCHHPEYLHQFLGNRIAAAPLKRMGFPWSEALVTRTLTSVGGTVLTTELALEQGIALHLSGGYHHAHYDFGSGYCVFNDLVIAAEVALTRPAIHKVVIFDLDVHQGDGTAALCQSRPEIISCSVHCDSNFPSRKQRSDFDFGLARGCQDDDYLQSVSEALALVTRLHQPDLLIYDAGVDVHHQDRLGHLSISNRGLRRREQLVLSYCLNNNLPVACVIGGGYDRDPEALTHRHRQLFDAALELL